MKVNNEKNFSKIVRNGDFIEFEGRLAWLGCCDCGLYHLLVSPSDVSNLKIMVYRDDQLTETLREHFKDELKVKL